MPAPSRPAKPGWGDWGRGETSDIDVLGAGCPGAGRHRQGQLQKRGGSRWKRSFYRDFVTFDRLTSAFGDVKGLTRDVCRGLTAPARAFLVTNAAASLKPSARSWLEGHKTPSAGRGEKKERKRGEGGAVVVGTGGGEQAGHQLTRRSAYTWPLDLRFGPSCLLPCAADPLAWRILIEACGLGWYLKRKPGTLTG